MNLGFVDGLYISALGLAGVFLVLTLFYVTIRTLQKIGAKEKEE